MAALLHEAQGGTKQEASWLRQVKAWRSGTGPQTLDDENARQLGEVLDADFTSFVFDPTDKGWRDLLQEVRAGLVSLDERVAALEERRQAE